MLTLKLAEQDVTTVVQALIRDMNYEVAERVLKAVYALVPKEGTWVSLATVSTATGVQGRIRRTSMDAKLIQAIKELRAVTGMGLKESKDVIDRTQFAGEWEDIPKPLTFAHYAQGFDGLGFEVEVYLEKP